MKKQHEWKTRKGACFQMPGERLHVCVSVLFQTVCCMWQKERKRKKEIKREKERKKTREREVHLERERKKKREREVHLARVREREVALVRRRQAADVTSKWRHLRTTKGNKNGGRDGGRVERCATRRLALCRKENLVSAQDDVHRDADATLTTTSTTMNCDKM